MTKKITPPASINQTIEDKIGTFTKTMIVSGPVIIQERNGKTQTLLVKHGDKPEKELKWKFCGGKLLKGWDLKENAIREAKEEIGVEINITGELPTIALWSEQPETGTGRPDLILLIHYLAKIADKPKADKELIDMQWFDIDNLPTDCSPNVKPIIEEYKKLYK